MNQAPSVALTIAGFDPSSGAGITADLKTFAAHEVFGVACISSLTVQSTLGVRSVERLSPVLVRDTLQCLVEDVFLNGVKIGMLGSAAVAHEVASFLTAHSGVIPRQRIVLDPVVCSSSGATLLDREGLSLLREQLLPRVGCITPNIDELSLLTEHPVDRAQVAAAARLLKAIAAQKGNEELAVVVTGGHFDLPDDFLLTETGEEFWLEGERVATSSTHGTGCAFSSALLCGLIAGKNTLQAVAAAKVYVTEALRTAYPIGQGNGPINHLFRLPS